LNLNNIAMVQIIPQATFAFPRLINVVAKILSSRPSSAVAQFRVDEAYVV